MWVVKNRKNMNKKKGKMMMESGSKGVEPRKMMMESGMVLSVIYHIKKMSKIWKWKAPSSNLRPWEWQATPFPLNQRCFLDIDLHPLIYNINKRAQPFKMKHNDKTVA